MITALNAKGLGTLARPIDTTTGVFTSTGNALIVGTGGKVGLTINDGDGNANITFNHASKVPDQTGSAGRIDCGVDNDTGYMRLRVKNSVTGGTSVSLPECLRIEEDYVRAYENLYVDGDLRVGSTDPRYKLDVNGIIRTNNNLYVDGDLGIGKTNPGSKLDVAGNINLDGSGRQIYFATGGV